MNRDLLARTNPEFYVGIIACALDHGADEEAVSEFVAEQIRAAQALLDGKCPECGAPSARYVDYKLQQGYSEMPGVWVQYRCSTAPPPGRPRGDGACAFMADLKESEASN